MKRAVFLDRDGVLNKAFPRGGTTHPPRTLDELVILPGVVESVIRLREAGFLRICITNQPDVVRGTQIRDNVNAINQNICAALELDDIFICWHDSADGCDCRKPKPGLLFTAAQKWAIDLPRSWMVGDRDSDVMAGRNAGCHTIGIGQGIMTREADAICPDLSAAVSHILQQDANLIYDIR